MKDTLKLRSTFHENRLKTIIARANKGSSGLDDPLLERDICKIVRAYFLRDAVFDIAANVPILIYVLIHGNPTTAAEIEEASENTLFMVLMLLKTLPAVYTKGSPLSW